MACKSELLFVFLLHIYSFSILKLQSHGQHYFSTD